MKYPVWLNDWMENYIMPSSKQRTYTRYGDIVRLHIVTQLSEYEMSELSPLVLQKYVTELLNNGNLQTGEGLSANSVNGIITVLQNSLKLAYTLGIISEYNADKIKRPKATEKKVECFSLPEQKKIEQYMVSCRLSEARFDALSLEYEKEQAEVRARISELEASVISGEEQYKDLKRLLANVRKYTDPQELTAEMLNDLVDKILVHAPDKSSGHRKQKIEIYYNAVGIINLPNAKDDECVTLNRRTQVKVVG